MSRLDEKERAVAEMVAAAPCRYVFSAPADKAAGLRRATVTKGPGGWQAERLSATQAFHENFDDSRLPAVLLGLLAQFTQMTAFAAGREYQLRLTRKGRVLTTSRKTGPPPEEVPAGAALGGPASPPCPEKEMDIPVLREIGVITQEGRVAAARRDKYRQISRFVRLVGDALPARPPSRLRVVDLGCGMSYLTFVLFHYLARERGIEVEMTGVDRRAELVGRCEDAARRYGYGGLHFAACDIAAYEADAPVDMVVSLHACDTATDLALAKAAAWQARVIFAAPCCQHELNGQMRSETLSLLTRYGLVKERAAALMTDAVRAHLLVACGYKAQLLEFVDARHTPKNCLIRAEKTGQPHGVKQRALGEVRQLCEAFGLRPSLQALLAEKGLLPV